MVTSAFQIQMFILRKISPMDEQLEPILSMVFFEMQGQQEVGLTLTPAVHKLAQTLSFRYRVSVEEGDLLVCISSIHAMAVSLILSHVDCPLRNERTVLDSFMRYAVAIIDVEDFRRGTPRLDC
jgi:hypothetical protein